LSSVVTAEIVEVVAAAVVVVGEVVVAAMQWTPMKNCTCVCVCVVFVCFGKSRVLESESIFTPLRSERNGGASLPKWHGMEGGAQFR
jgi:hypothetical protein